LLLSVLDITEPEETVGALMAKCSRHVIPPAVLELLADQKGHDL